jgi:hypothetical protein
MLYRRRAAGKDRVTERGPNWDKPELHGEAVPRHELADKPEVGDAHYVHELGDTSVPVEAPTGHEHR